MKRIFMILALLLIITGCDTKVEQKKDIEEVTDPVIEDEIVYPSGYVEYDHNGVERKYILYVPVNVVEDAPIVFLLHGYTGLASMMNLATKMNDVADEFGFVVVYPQGLIANRVTHWNADLDLSENDDIGFIVELAGFLHTEYGFSDENVFSSGFSNGGFMSYTLACKASTSFKAIASMSGVMSGETWDSCDPIEPVPVLHIHGTSDGVVPIDGSMSEYGGWGGAPDLDTIIEFWKSENNVSLNTTIIASELVVGVKTISLLNNNQVWYYKIEGFGHGWPNDSSNEIGLNASELIWEFFTEFIE